MRAAARPIASIGWRIHDHDVYLCGPEPWMASVRRDLRAAGVPAAQIHSEAFGV